MYNVVKVVCVVQLVFDLLVWHPFMIHFVTMQIVSAIAALRFAARDLTLLQAVIEMGPSMLEKGKTEMHEEQTFL